MMSVEHRDWAQQALAGRYGATDWQIDALSACRQRLGAARTPADRGALLREAARLAGGSVTMPTVLVDGVDSERFGLDIVAVSDTAHASVRALLPHSGLPDEVRRTLGHLLPLDPNTRRHDQAAAPDGLLRHLTPHLSYRNRSQKAAVRALMTMPGGGTLVVTLATGTGKSLLFQLGVRWWRERATGGERPTTLVLVPTIALALDHEWSARSFPGLEESRALVGSLDVRVREEIILGFRQGVIPVLFVSPEMALGTLRDVLEEAARPPGERPPEARGRLSAVFVDEAHIVATWGRSFRPDLQRLSGLVRRLRARNTDLRTVLLSATIDQGARDLLLAQYGNCAQTLEVAERAPRYEFDLVEHQFDDARMRDNATVALLDVLPRPALVYATRVRDAKALYERARDEQGFGRIALFTGNTQPSQRQDIVEQWRSGHIDVVFATSAFGMGVDKQDVRAVVHACVPESASRYYQEIGRAGRDGHQALTVFFHAPADVPLARSIASGDTLTVENVRRRWPALRRALRNDGVDSWTHRTRYRVRLDVSDHLRYADGPHNINWNRSLLVQMQRYGALRVAAAEDDRSDWAVIFTNAGMALLEGEEVAGPFLEELFSARTQEERAAARMIDDFLDLWRDRWSCRLSALFREVEVDAPVTPHCGRCPTCRARNVPVPRAIDHYGGQVQWPREAGVTPSPRVVIVPYDEHSIPARLVTFVAGRGVEQIVAPARLCGELAEAWAQRIPDRPGWILGWEEVGPDAASLRPLAVPTAMVVAPEISQQARDAMWRWAERWHEGGGPLAWWAAPAATRVGGRALEDVATNRPALDLPDLGDDTA